MTTPDKATDAPRPKVLYVDDQLGNLTVFRASMRRFADVTTATSGEEALKLLETETFPIVISDQRMEGMTGTELLTQVRRLYPDTVRILLTAHSDFSAVIDAINNGQIARFVRKPWDRGEMRVLLLDASRMYWKTVENRALTKQFIQQARLAAVGQMTAGFAHELLNLTCKLRLIDDIAEQFGSQAVEQSQELRIVRSGVDRVESLAGAVRDLARGKAPEASLRREEISSLIESWMISIKLLPAVRTLRNLTFQPSSQKVYANVDAGKLELILINLVKNAAEATAPFEGDVSVSVEDSEDSVSIHVRDNGPGIPQTLSARIWEPMFTTKGSNGTGLGLLMSRTLATAQGGKLLFWVDDEGRTTFTISLQASTAAARQVA